jgi:hypothetical protein
MFLVRKTVTKMTDILQGDMMLVKWILIAGYLFVMVHFGRVILSEIQLTLLPHEVTVASLCCMNQTYRNTAAYRYVVNENIYDIPFFRSVLEPTPTRADVTYSQWNPAVALVGIPAFDLFDIGMIIAYFAFLIGCWYRVIIYPDIKHKHKP